MLYDELTLAENIKYYGKLYGIKNSVIKSNGSRLLRLFELESKFQNFLYIPARFFSAKVRTMSEAN